MCQGVLKLAGVKCLVFIEDQPGGVDLYVVDNTTQPKLLTTGSV